MNIYQHADGDHYRILHQGEHVKLKCPKSGKWEPAVVYRAVDLSDDGSYFDKRPDEFLTTTVERFTERFKLVDAAPTQ